MIDRPARLRDIKKHSKPAELFSYSPLADSYSFDRRRKRTPLNDISARRYLQASRLTMCEARSAIRVELRCHSAMAAREPEARHVPFLASYLAARHEKSGREEEGNYYHSEQRHTHARRARCYTSIHILLFTPLPRVFSSVSRFFRCFATIQC